MWNLQKPKQGVISRSSSFFLSIIIISKGNKGRTQSFDNMQRPEDVAHGLGSLHEKLKDVMAISKSDACKVKELTTLYGIESFRARRIKCSRQGGFLSLLWSHKTPGHHVAQLRGVIFLLLLKGSARLSRSTILVRYPNFIKVCRCWCF